MNKNRKLLISLLVVLFLLMLPVSAYGFEINKEEKTTNGEITADLKVRTTGGNWQDTLTSVNLGTVIEFQITVSIPRDYFWLGILVELPSTQNGPMFNYRIGSMKPTILDEDVGITYANDEEVSWSWIDVEPPFEETMTFKATVKETGSKNINLLVGGDYGENGQVKEDQGSDSLRFSSAKSKSKNPFIKLNLIY